MSKVTAHEIRGALCELLHALCLYRDTPRESSEDPGDCLVTIADIPDGHMAEVWALSRDPIGKAYWNAMHVLAVGLHEVGGYSEMTNFINEIAHEDSVTDGRRKAGYLDKIFDGIGGWTA